jgi:SIR2-like domain
MSEILAETLRVRLEQEPVVFFVGSAISIWKPSGLPLAPDLVNALMKTLAEGTGFEEVPLLTQGITWPRLENALQELHYCVGDRAIGALAPLNGGRPNAYHAFLATQLMRAKILYTTNQDELIERALESTGHQRDRNFRIWSPGEPWTRSDTPTIVKLHGTGTNARSIRATLRQVHQGLPRDIAEQLAEDLSTRSVCFLGYSGNDIDIGRVLHATEFHSAFWVTRSGAGLAGRLADEGKRVLLVRADLRVFLDESSPLTQGDASAELTEVRAFSNALDPFLRMCAVSRCVGMARPDNAKLHKRCIRILANHASRHPDAWRAFYDAGERRNRGAGPLGGLIAFSQYARGYKLALRRNPVGALLCLRGMWMSCDLTLLGLFPFTYRPGLHFLEPRARRLLVDVPQEDRAYFSGLVDLLQLRALLKLRHIPAAVRLAKGLVDASASSPHLRGHGLRFLARANALRGEHADVETLLAAALEQFEYAESVVDQRNVHRIGVLCALERRDPTAAVAHLEAVGRLGRADPRERLRNRLLILAVWHARRGWWSLAKLIADWL